jgi:SpoIIAA-like
LISIEHDREHYLVCRISGTFTKADFEAAAPQIENELELREGRLRLMVVLENFHGWDAGALWEEMKFNADHDGQLGRIAVLGDSASEEWGVTLANPFFGSEMRFYAMDDRAAARTWLTEGRGEPVAS